MPSLCACLDEHAYDTLTFWNESRVVTMHGDGLVYVRLRAVCSTLLRCDAAFGPHCALYGQLHALPNSTLPYLSSEQLLLPAHRAMAYSNIIKALRWHLRYSN